MSQLKAEVRKVSQGIASILQNAQQAQMNGDYVLAEELYLGALDKSPDHPATLQQLALLYMANNMPEKAIPYLSKAADLVPGNAKLLYNLGLAYQQCTEIPAAIHYYKLAAEQDCNFVQAYNNLGVAYQHLGKLDLANMYLEKAFKLEPDCVEAYYNFSQTHKFSTADAILIKHIEALAKQKQANNPADIKLNFTLGKIHDDLGNFENAFQYYEKANKLKFQGFDSRGINQYIDTIINIYSPQRIQALTSKIDPSNKRFIFVVGMPRSGTTLVEQIISSHPLVQSGGEIGFIGDVIDELPDMVNSRQPYPQCLEQFNSLMFSQLAQKFNVYLDNMGGNFLNITDKSPINFLHLGLIRILFPQSVLIHVNRNPIATCLSCYFQNFDKQHQYSYDLDSLANFYNAYRKIMQHWNKMPEMNILSVQYENLVTKSKSEMSKIIEFCGLDWDSNCESFYAQQNVVNSASKWQTRQPIYDSSIAKWKNYQPYIQSLMGKLEEE